ncbi:hypothetical protein [Aurantimonas endophytica]|uniref:hypothetical protein n=1 Tax=Aurantimonas endophytica TaxID=1522175 RepID=UPI001605FF1A|nr:hypothetical protein [Aurantimonas endophytica]
MRSNDLSRVLVRPPVLIDKRRPAGAGTHEPLAFHSGTISREDVARFVLDQVHADEWMHESPRVKLIGGKPATHRGIVVPRWHLIFEIETS